MILDPPPNIATVTSVPDAIAGMKTIAASLPKADGLAIFNQLYLSVTCDINAKLKPGQQFFSNPGFITKLDIIFANLYFDVINNAAEEPMAVPLAWRPLIEQRSNPGITSIQFALAGMNSHINHDLPLAARNTCIALGTPPDTDDYHRDYQKIDGLLDAAQQSLRQEFETQDEHDIDHNLSAVINLVGSWSIEDARDVAWRNAIFLWEVRNEATAQELFLDALSAGVALGSRTLLAVL